jgi:cell division protein FtsA
MSRHTLAAVVEPRYQELFELVQKELKDSGMEEQIAAGVVMTGGTPKMEGAVEFAEEIFQIPVRLGSPAHIKGLADYVDDPVYASCVGLLHDGRDDLLSKRREKRTKDGVTGLWARVHSWFKGEF